MQTQEETINIFKVVLFPPVFPEDVEPLIDINGKTLNVTNFLALQKEIGGKDFTELELHAMVQKLRTDGTFVKKQFVAPPPVDPATTLPHDNIPELKNIRNLADVIRVKNLPKEKLMRFANLKAGSPSFKEFNERIQYIYDHKIGDGELPTIVDKTEQSESENPDEPYTKARAIVNAISAKDVGSIGSGPGQSGWEKANRFKERVGKIIDSEERKGTSGPAVLKWVKQELADLQSSSAR